MTSQKAPDADQGAEGEDRNTIKQEGETIVNSMTDSAAVDQAQTEWVALVTAAYEARLSEVADSEQVRELMAKRGDLTAEGAAKIATAERGIDLPVLPDSMMPAWGERCEYMLWGVGELNVTIYGPSFPFMDGQLSLSRGIYVTLSEDALDDEDGPMDGEAVGDVRMYTNVIPEEVSLENIETAAQARELAAVLEQIARLLDASERGA